MKPFEPAMLLNKRERLLFQDKKMKRKLIIFFTMLAISVTSLFADVTLSDKTKDLLEDLMTLKISLMAEKSPRTSLSMLDSWISKTKGDYDSLNEVEQMVVTNMIDCERYTYNSRLPDTKKMLDKLLSAQCKLNKKYIEAHKKEKLDPWILLSAGSVTSCYMALEPLKTAFTYGYWVRDLFAEVVERAPNMSHAQLNLAQWYYYCPGILGGSKKKAKELFRKSFEVASTDHDRFESAVLMSQLAFDEKDTANYEKYIAIAEAISPNNFYLHDILNTNRTKNESVFKYHGHKAEE